MWPDALGLKVALFRGGLYGRIRDLSLRSESSGFESQAGELRGVKHHAIFEIIGHPARSTAS